MIFVTVGTHWFDELIEVVDSAVGNGEIRHTVLLQIGYGGRYVPKYCQYLTGAPTLVPFYRAAQLVIGHGGTGTTLEVLTMGKPLISVANPAMKDHHQHEFLTALEAEGWAIYCRDLRRLAGMASAPIVQPRSISVGRQLADSLAHDLEETVPEARQRRTWFCRLMGRLVARSEIDRERTARRSIDESSVWTLVQTPVGFTGKAIRF